MLSLGILSKAQINQVQDASQEVTCTAQIQSLKRWMACSNIMEIAPNSLMRYILCKLVGHLKPVHFIARA